MDKKYSTSEDDIHALYTKYKIETLLGLLDDYESICHFKYTVIFFFSLLDESEANVWGEYNSCMKKHWVCPRCEVDLIVSVQERLEHESECQSQNFEPTQQEEAQEIEDEKQAQMNPLRKHYFCEKCDKGFRFTTTEILKHKKSHVT